MRVFISVLVDRKGTDYSQKFLSLVVTTLFFLSKGLLFSHFCDKSSTVFCPTCCILIVSRQDQVKNESSTTHCERNGSI